MSFTASRRTLQIATNICRFGFFDLVTLFTLQEGSVVVLCATLDCLIVLDGAIVGGRDIVRRLVFTNSEPEDVCLGEEKEELLSFDVIS